ncbi:MAG: extracellular solute-binding protein [Clostridiaceae bacterium]|nr:extracellular solute-binding protein [Clostridiaceae bacterium]
MNKNIRKSLVLVLICLLAVAMLAACNGGAAVTTGTQTNGTTAAGSNTAGTTTGAAKTHVLKIMGPESTNTYIKFADRERYSSWKAFEKLFTAKGITPEFEIIANDQYETVIQTRMASATDLPDFTNLTNLDDTTILNLANQGVILPVNKIIDENSDGTAKEFFSTGRGKLSNSLNTTEDGNVYWISQIQATTYADQPGSTCMGINIRKDWLDKLGLKTPTTADEFVAVMQAFRDQDANGNGQADEVLAFNPASFTNGIAQWFGLVSEISSFGIEDMKATSPWYQDGIKPYFTFLNKLVDLGIMDTSIIGAKTDDQLNQKIAEDKVGALFTYAMQTWYEPSVKTEGAEYMPIGPLKAADGIEPVNAIEPPFLSYGRWGFTKACTDLEAAGSLVDILCSEDYQNLTQYGIEGETYEMKDGKKVLMDVALNANWEKAAAAGTSIGDSLWANGSMFPKRRFVGMEAEIGVVPAYKADYQKAVIQYHPTTPLGTGNYYPVPTQAQIDRKLEIITDLTTRSEELATQLILGQASMDKWDTYMQELKDLGLDDLIQINQTLLDRYQQNSK